jgi:hypothetical protein
MKRRLRRAVLTLGATLLVGAMSAGAAQAEQSYRTSASPTTLSGTQVAAVKIHVPGAGTVECTSFNLTGTVTGTAVSTIELHPEFPTACVAFGFASTHILTTGCNFRFLTPVKNQAAMEIVCSGANTIKITPTFFGASVCTVEIGSQKPSGVVDLTNNAGKTDVLMTFTVTEVAHTAGCGASAAADGEITGSVTEVGAGHSFWVE